jgi:hypothetical protein
MLSSNTPIAYSLLSLSKKSAVRDASKREGKWSHIRAFQSHGASHPERIRSLY